ELVFVNTPNDSHYDYAMEALKAGKHVVVEKPFTVTAEEADALIAFARQQKKKLTVYQNRRWDGGFLTIRRILDQNLLGRIVEFELHYDRYRNYIEAGTWKEKDQRGTGILYNLGSHMLDQVLVLFGAPKSIDARMGIQRTGGEVIDYYDIRLQYDGLNVIVKSSYLVREAGPMYRVNGTSGSFVKNGIDPQEQALKEKLVPGGPGWGTEPREWWGRLNTEINGLHVEGVVETIPGNYPAFYQNLYEAIRLDKPLAVNPEQSRDVIRLIEAAIESNRTQAAVTFAP
ncbi:MAG TPA: Gfo/Idh/MocA family oxidoreductase, partial [Chryseosolibacter sp.]|nr:Gfo/Idh/MocA family oxidoreductase [Chryseosolibacter sp.]